MKARMILFLGILLGVAALGLAFAGPAQAVPVGLTPQEELGKALFFDTNLSLNSNQSCATCHAPAVGFVGPDAAINAAGAVYEGSVPGAFGDRKPPSAAYAGDSPILHYDAANEVWVGGMFWDGRATGYTLGDPLAEQAKGPFLNPMEQALVNPQALCQLVAASTYAGLYESVWGAGSLECDAHALEVYDRIGRSIAAYERSPEVTAFTSKFDAFYLRAVAKGLDVSAISEKNWNQYRNLGLTTAELKGMAIFNTRAMCSACHTLAADVSGFPLFTDFTYDNLGIPRNPLNPYSAAHPDWADPGLGGYLKSAGFDESVYAAEMGKFKVPTLRNVAKAPDNRLIKAYGHNGYFKSLKEIVHFYNTRDVKPWPTAETPQNVNTDELGNLGLTEKDEDLIITFMKTLSDGWMK